MSRSAAISGSAVVKNDRSVVTPAEVTVNVPLKPFGPWEISVVVLPERS